MSIIAPELSLAWCLALQLATFYAGLRFARRCLGSSGVQACLDAILLAYAIQYVAVCLPGLLGCLDPARMTLVAIIQICLLLALTRHRSAAAHAPLLMTGAIYAAVAIGFYVVAHVLAMAYCQRVLPIMAEDALTYHVPAAVQWLQTGRIGLLPVWFFNPANTFSPLGGSIFIAWLLAPFGSDIAARFVELPALLLAGLAMFQLCRRLGLNDVLGALTAAAACLSQPLFNQAMMAKDDLFVLALFLLSLLSISSLNESDRAETSGSTAGIDTPPGNSSLTSAFSSSLRLGLSLGLLLAMKYTALFCLPMLLLAIPKPNRANLRRIFWAMLIAMTLAGPWFARNWIVTGNPLFPVDLTIGPWHLLHGLFQPGRSEALRNGRQFIAVLTKGTYAMPALVFWPIVVGWMVALLSLATRGRDQRTLRALLLGPLIGLWLFYFRAPFPELRFLFPTLALLFIATAVALQRWLPKPFAIAAAASLLLVSIATQYVSDFLPIIAGFALVGAVTAAIGCLLMLLWQRKFHGAVKSIGLVAGLALAAMIYVDFSASCDEYVASTLQAWANMQPGMARLWAVVRDPSRVPAGATIAYTGSYRIYPLQGFHFDHRVVYAPTRPGVVGLQDLPSLEGPLSGEELVRRAVAATRQMPSRECWLKNLHDSGARYLVVCREWPNDDPVEWSYVHAEPARFTPIFQSATGGVFAINR